MMPNGTNYCKFQATLFLGEWGAECKSLQLNCRISVYVEGLLPPGKEGEGLGGGGLCQPIVLPKVGRQYLPQK